MGSVTVTSSTLRQPPARTRRQSLTFTRPHTAAPCIRRSPPTARAAPSTWHPRHHFPWRGAKSTSRLSQRLYRLPTAPPGTDASTGSPGTETHHANRTVQVMPRRSTTYPQLRSCGFPPWRSGRAQSACSTASRLMASSCTASQPFPGYVDRTANTLPATSVRRCGTTSRRSAATSSRRVLSFPTRSSDATRSASGSSRPRSNRSGLATPVSVHWWCPWTTVGRRVSDLVGSSTGSNVPRPFVMRRSRNSLCASSHSLRRTRRSSASSSSSLIRRSLSRRGSSTSCYRRPRRSSRLFCRDGGSPRISRTASTLTATHHSVV
jgi:hypothetical protein